MKVETICENPKCKQPFTAKRPDQKFCHSQCKNQFWKEVRNEGLKVLRAAKK
jgi:hypothetical protein